MIDQLESIKERFEEVSQQIVQPEAVSDQKTVHEAEQGIQRFGKDRQCSIKPIGNCSKRSKSQTNHGHRSAMKICAKWPKPNSMNWCRVGNRWKMR
jgi:protein subunit release factor A